jgi:hypothetical protein
METEDVKYWCKTLAKSHLRISPQRRVATSLVNAGATSAQVQEVTAGYDGWNTIIQDMRDHERTGGFVPEPGYGKGHYEIIG